MKNDRRTEIKEKGKCRVLEENATKCMKDVVWRKTVEIVWLSLRGTSKKRNPDFSRFFPITGAEDSIWRCLVKKMFGEFPGFTVKIIEDGDVLFEKFQLENLKLFKKYSPSSMIFSKDLRNLFTAHVWLSAFDPP